MFAMANETFFNDWNKLCSFCSSLGKDPLLVQGAGGNISFKDDDVLWIKASGMWIADAERQEIFVPVNLKQLQIELEKGNFSISPQTIGDTVMRPSIETLLHALLPHKIVLHLHAVDPLSHLVRKGIRERLPHLMGGRDKWICVDYFKPGADLAHAISKELNTCPDAEIIFMLNHGVVVGADCVDGISKILDRLIKNMIIEPYIHEDIVRPPEDDHLSQLGYSACTTKGINQLAKNENMLLKLKTAWALYPDHLVFLNAKPAILGDTLSLSELSRLGSKPVYIFVPGVGVYQHETVTLAHEAQLRCYFDVLSRQDAKQDLVTLNIKQINEIVEWDAEHYRQSQIVVRKPER